MKVRGFTLTTVTTGSAEEDTSTLICLLGQAERILGELTLIEAKGYHHRQENEEEPQSTVKLRILGV